jgi:predicted nucleic acid-binding protein
MTSSVVLDSNVIVGYLDQEDSLHQRARALLERLECDHALVLLDFIVAEALSCRRADSVVIHRQMALGVGQRWFV